MSRYLMLARSPLLVGFAGGLLLALSACHATQSEPTASDKAAKAEPQQVAPVLLNEAVTARSRSALAVSPAADLSASLSPTPLFSPRPLIVEEEQSAATPQVSGERYQSLADNPVLAVADSPVSTFSIDVDTGGYANIRRFLNQGQLPPTEAVRLEELVNYFPYTYAPSRGDAPFGVSTELAVSPWNPNSRLLRIAIKAQDLAAEAMPSANLVFLVDISGSMDRRDGLPLVQSTLKLLVEQLRPQDKVSLVTYAGTSTVVLTPTAGSEKAKIRNAIDQLSAGGSTAGESGIQLAYQQAQQGFIPGGINRILLATDGDFNVGISDFDSLKQLAADKRKTGISLTTLGFGTDNYNEQLMEQLADAGDGNYAYIDNLREARKVLVDQLSSTLATVAKDVKLQVEFNPSQVSEYRLLGYENRALKREDFSNDKVDAGEIGAGHNVTALYEIVPAGNKGWLEPLRYQTATPPQSGVGELALLRIRYKAPEQSQSRLLEVPIAVQQDAVAIAQASEDLRFAAAVAAFAQQLKGGRYTGSFDLAASAELARGAKGEDRFGLRAEFVQLVELAQSLHTAASSTASAPDPLVKVD
ncbi:MAG: VWA domain-containing protein [Pseudomonadota bacterium]